MARDIVLFCLQLRRQKFKLTYRVKIFATTWDTDCNGLQSDDMWMCAHLQYVDFPTDFLRHLHVLNFPFVQNLHSHFLASDDVMGHCNWYQVFYRLGTREEKVAWPLEKLSEKLFYYRTTQLSSLCRTFNFPKSSDAESFAEAVLPQHNWHIVHRRLSWRESLAEFRSSEVTESDSQWSQSAAWKTKLLQVPAIDSIILRSMSPVL